MTVGDGTVVFLLRPVPVGDVEGLAEEVFLSRRDFDESVAGHGDRTLPLPFRNAAVGTAFSVKRVQMADNHVQRNVLAGQAQLMLTTVVELELRGKRSQVSWDCPLYCMCRSSSTANLGAGLTILRA